MAFGKEPVKLTQWVTIALIIHSYSLCQICFILSFIWVSKNLSNPISRDGEIGHFNQSLLTESFPLTFKFHSLILSNMKNTCRIFIYT